MENIKNVYMVSHTHWDREWYLTRENFRFMLLDLIDRLLDILDNDSGYKAFMLDGQTIALEDYLELRPENKEKLKNYVKEGRIQIGPWYVLPDELLISGEAHIRNYMIGEEVCRSFGGKMNYGYLPDAFGHPSQLPQLIKGLGMDEIIFWRGVGPELHNTEFKWLGLDGTEIYAVNMPFGYGNAAHLPEEKEHFLRRIKNEVNKLAGMTQGDIILLMNGVDHLAPQYHLSKMLDTAKEEFDFNIKHTTLPEYIEALKAQNLNMERYQGELRSPKRAYLLGGTISTRMYIKQKNFAVEQMLEKWLEPLASMIYLNNGNYPAVELKKLWKDALANLPHDSICGCSVDEVHREMMMRYKWIEELGGSLMNRLAEKLTSLIAADKKGHYGLLVAVNTLEHERRDIVNAVLELESEIVRGVDFDLGLLMEYKTSPDRKLPSAVRIFDDRDREVQCSLDKAEFDTVMKLSLDNQPEMHRIMRLHVSFIADTIPAMGYKTYRYDLVYDGAKANDKVSNDFTMENEYFIVIPDSETGALEIIDKSTGKTYTGCNQLQDSGDAGDEYTYSPPLNDETVNIKNGSVELFWLENTDMRKSIKIKSAMELPLNVTEDRKNRSSEKVICPVESTITLYSGIRRIDVATSFENKAKDHILKVVFPTGMRVKVSYSEGIFGVDKHDVRDLNDKTDYSDWIEAPCGTNSQKTFVDVSDDNAGITIANRGITESTVYDDGNQTYISLTLLRCVEWLSRQDLLLRKGNAGWPLHTPEAQCQGTYNFEYSIIPHKSDWDNGGSVPAAHDFATPLKAFNKEEAVGTLPDSFSYMSISVPEIVVSAVKKSEKENELVIRMLNQSASDIDAGLELNFKVDEVFETALNENRTAKLEVESGKINLKFKPWQIRTISVRL